MKKRKKDMARGSNKNYNFLSKRWPSGCLFILALLACHRNNNATDYTPQFIQISNIKPLLKNGDIIVRNGTDDVSRATRHFNRKDTTYSHCGIIQLENDTVFVYHALGGSFNPSQTLMRQPIDSFCNPGEVDKFAVYRYSLTLVQSDKLTGLIRKYYISKLPFDIFFNYTSDDKMYCSEFVFKILNNIMSGYLETIHPKESPVYISIDDLYLNDKAALIKKVIF